MGGFDHKAVDTISGANAGASAIQALLERLHVGGQAGQVPLGFGGVGLGVLGGGIGGLRVADGVGDIRDGNTSEGVLDVTAGGLGVASGVSSTLAGLGTAGVSVGGGAVGAAISAATPLAMAAGLAGLGAYGNSYAQQHGWYGKNDEPAARDAVGNPMLLPADHEPTNATFLGSIGNTATDGWHAGHDAADVLVNGDNWANTALGATLGTIGGGLGGASQTIVNAGAAMAGGVARGWHAIRD